MSDDLSFQIEIPADDNGFILLQCPYCGTYFKIATSDAEDKSILKIVCPSCGLESESYLTADVIDLAQAIINNKAMDLIHNEFKKMERNFRRGPVTFKAGKPPKHEREDPLHSGIEAMETAHFPCCKRTAKIKPLLIMTGCYCPFCGVKNYEIE